MLHNGRRILCAGLFLVAAASAPLALSVSHAEATEIRYVVNNTPLTSYDIDRRAAFLRLQRQGGDVRQKAADEMIDQILRQQEMKRLNININDSMVDEAYQRFAGNNKLTVSQLNQVMADAGVTSAHFKEFIRTQIGWGRVLQARSGSGTELTEQDVVAKMLQQGGQKPSATEYMLQRVVFVVPSAQRSSLLAKRRREAEAMRGRFRGCDTTREFAKGLLDVTVRDLGRVLEPELPPDWKDFITSTAPGSATQLRETEAGVEFIGVCSAREVSDDRVAQMVFQSEETGNEVDEATAKEYMSELRSRASIVQR